MARTPLLAEFELSIAEQLGLALDREVSGLDTSLVGQVITKTDVTRLLYIQIKQL